MTCRDEILACVKEITIHLSTEEFCINDVIRCMERKGSQYSESTIRTHITSRMCANAPDNHAVTYDDFERAGYGKYRCKRTE